MTHLVGGLELAGYLHDAVPDAVEAWDDTQVWVRPERIGDVCRFLKEEGALSFDYLASVSAVDYIEHFEVVYHLTSLRHNHRAIVKAKLYEREAPAAPSVTSLWRGADLQEREIWDLMGITFTGHPNMKRILLWEGFPGHPLRKDHRGG